MSSIIIFTCIKVFFFVKFLYFYSPRYHYNYYICTISFYATRKIYIKYIKYFMIIYD